MADIEWKPYTIVLTDGERAWLNIQALDAIRLCHRSGLYPEPIAERIWERIFVATRAEKP